MYGCRGSSNERRRGCFSGCQCVDELVRVFDPKYNWFMFGPEKQSMLFSTKAFHGE